MIFKKVSGLDLSMTATGATHEGEDGVACTHVIKPRTRGDARLVEIADRVLEYVEGSDLVLIEGYLNHSHSAGITGMVHGAVRDRLIRAGIAYATFPPSSNKKYATGRGNATKTDMALAALKRAGLEFRDDNACDSWWLYVAAADYLECPVLDLPEAQREALAAINMEG